MSIRSNAEIREDINRCIRSILEAHDIPGDIEFTECYCSHIQPDTFIAFLNWHAGAHFAFDKREILKILLKGGIRSKKDYRQLRNLVRERIKDAAWDMKCLAEDTLRNLGG